MESKIRTIRLLIWGSITQCKKAWENQAPMNEMKLAGTKYIKVH